MTRKEAINQLQDAKDGYEEYLTEEAIEMAIQALLQINDIKAIINNPMYIQEDVLRYQMICEVVKG